MKDRIITIEDLRGKKGYENSDLICDVWLEGKGKAKGNKSLQNLGLTHGEAIELHRLLCMILYPAQTNTGGDL